jgi:hypothetical protein
VFYNIGSPEILQLFDGISRIISKKDPWRGEHDNGYDGLKTISQLKYSIDEKSENPNDNVFTINNSKIMIINISTFLTHIPFGTEEYYNYDLREPKRKIINPDKIKETTKTVALTQDWSNIPYYPTTLEKKENIAKYLASMGKQVPQSLLHQISTAKKIENDQDAFNNFTKSISTENINQNSSIHQFSSHNSYNYKLPTQLNRNQQQKSNPPPNKYSQQYASYIGVKPKAQTSARISMGGSF